MKPTTITSMALVAGTYFFGALAAGPKIIRDATPTKEGTPVPSTRPVLNQLTSHGCYASRGNMTLERDGTEVTSGKCGEYCKKKKALALALRGSKCYCGDAYPPKSDVVSDSKCNFPCPGYLWEACGSLDDDIYSIFNTGIELDVPEYEEEEEETSTSATPSSTQPVDKTDPADSTATTTDPSSSDGDKGDKKDGPNVAAIAAGVVVGVIVFGAGIGGLFFFMRRKRNAEIEEEHRRNAAVNAFINGSKPPGSSGSISMTDSRLDPVMAHRRLSDGSIADNQDYSRRILRVTNA